MTPISKSKNTTINVFKSKNTSRMIKLYILRFRELNYKGSHIPVCLKKFCLSPSW